jgi:hypothetical protein
VGIKKVYEGKYGGFLEMFSNLQHIYNKYKVFYFLGFLIPWFLICLCIRELAYYKTLDRYTNLK